MFNNLFNKYFKISFIIFVIIDILSYFAYLNDIFHIIIFIILSLMVLGFTLVKLEYGLYILLAELFIGSQGHLFALDTSKFGFSIRMIVFSIVFLVWLAKIFYGKHMDFFKKSNNFLYVYLLLFVVLAIGTLNGLLNNQLNNVFFDINGWLYFAVVPLFFSLIKSEKVIKNIISVLLAAVCFISVKTLFVLIIFAYPWPINISVFYTWLRDSRIGELTHVTGSYYRIFFQAQIYVMIGFFISFLVLIFRDKLQIQKESIKWLRWTALLTSTTIIACLSRSFWVGAFSALLLIFGLLIFKYKFKFTKILKLTAIIILTIALEVSFLFVITGNLTDNWIKGRLRNPTEEAAGMSRISQLKPLWQSVNQNMILGAGFGKTVTYQSNDPRILAKSPSGVYETYAFEWGYLDIWLKIGLIGMLIYLYLYYLVFKKGFKLLKKNFELSILITALLLGIVSLMATSMFSPYLNHPLGIGYLVIVSAVINYYSENLST